MAIKKVLTFQSSPSYIEDILDPESNEPMGKAFCIIDSATGDIYRYPMDTKVSKERGQELMGIGSVEIADGRSLTRLDKNHKAAKGGRL